MGRVPKSISTFTPEIQLGNLNLKKGHRGVTRYYCRRVGVDFFVFSAPSCAWWSFEVEETTYRLTIRGGDAVFEIPTCRATSAPSPIVALNIPDGGVDTEDNQPSYGVCVRGANAYDILSVFLRPQASVAGHLLHMVL